MPKTHIVQLTDDQRGELEGRYCGPLTLRQRNRVQILLRSDRGDTDEAIATALDICVATVVKVRKRFADQGLEAALCERQRCGTPPKFDGKVEATIIAVACSPTPDGSAQWTVKLIAGRLIEMQIVESISGRTVGRVLKKVGSNRGKRRRGACRMG